MFKDLVILIYFYIFWDTFRDFGRRRRSRLRPCFRADILVTVLQFPARDYGGGGGEGGGGEKK